MAKEQDGVTVFTFAKRSETTKNGEDKRDTQPGNERDHLSYTDYSGDRPIIFQDSTENNITDILSLDNSKDDLANISDFQENVTSVITPEIDNKNSTNHAIENEHSLELLNVQYSFAVNLDTILYCAVGKFNTAKITNGKLLRAMPENFNALWNKVRLMVTTENDSGDGIGETAEEILDQLEQTVSRNEKEMLIAKAEIAAMYSNLSLTSDSLISCIRLYEDVLAETKLINQNEAVNPLTEKLVVFWKCNLVRAYAKLTNANKELLANYGFHHDEVLSRLEELVLAVDNSDHIANHLKAETWVNLANTFEHFRQNYPGQSFRTDVCSGLSISDLLANAREYDPDNPRILMRSGRELRQRATSEQELTEAIDLLKRALKGEAIDGIRDIIYHQIGLAYRALWIHTQHPAREEILENTYKFPGNSLLPRASDVREQLGRRVIKPPDHPLDFNRIPRPCKEAPKLAFWRILMPIAPDPKHPYLLEAIKYFEAADRAADVPSTLYLLDIARIYSSARNRESAHEHFRKALKSAGSESISVDFVGVSLFETLAHFQECEVVRKAFTDFQFECIQETQKNVNSDSLADVFIGASLLEKLPHFEKSEVIGRAFRDSECERVKSLYRESIRFSTISKTKAVVAFYHILRIIYKQLSVSTDSSLPEMDRMILQNEYFLLYMAIQEAKQSRDIVNSLATNDFRIAVMWKLIDMFNRRNQQHDASASFTYLSILVMANKLTTEVRGINFTAIEKQRMLLLSAERVAQQRVTVVKTLYLLPHYKELCDLHNTGQDNASFQSEPLTDLEIAKLEIVMNIMRPEFIPVYSRPYERC